MYMYVLYSMFGKFRDMHTLIMKVLQHVLFTLLHTAYNCIHVYVHVQVYRCTCYCMYMYMYMCNLIYRCIMAYNLGGDDCTLGSLGYAPTDRVVYLQASHMTEIVGERRLLAP